MSEEIQPIESMESWLSNKPYWEQYLWTLCCDHVSLSEQMTEQCFTYLSEFLGLIPPISEDKPNLSLKGVGTLAPIVPEAAARPRLVEVRDFQYVNALSKECSIKCSPHLTLIYGGNGSGKSGVARIFANACFSRGQREILPDLKRTTSSENKAQATFLLAEPDGTAHDPYRYSLGSHNDALKRFAVFDSKSVLIHLDESNKVNFSPAYVQVFDRVATAIGRIERRLDSERIMKMKENPFASLFLDITDVSPTATFCKSLSSITRDDEFLEHANFVSEVDDAKILTLQNDIEEKRKIDVPTRRTGLLTNARDLDALRSSLQLVLDRFSKDKLKEANKIALDIGTQRRLVEDLSTTSFDDGRLMSTGSVKWRSLLVAAKELYDAEKKAIGDADPAHCLLCRQKLTVKEQGLFQRYWDFLASEAEAELAGLTNKKNALLADLRSVKASFPKLEESHSGVKFLEAVDPKYLVNLRAALTEIETVLDEWISKIDQCESVDRERIPTIDLARIQTLAEQQIAEAANLMDPTATIAVLSAQLMSLKHRKIVTTLKEKALDYLAFLRWSAKATNVNFPAIKMMTTKKRKEVFLVAVGEDYKKVFNDNLTELGCEFSLVMWTSGDQGSTVKEYKLEFSEDFVPSQILSEGEQKVCALADFLTEVSLDESNCGMIFDDPVTSLDHERKDKIAKRLALDAKVRQVVIFTHDVVFMSQIVRHASEHQIPFLAHWMRKVNGVPGHVKDNSSPKLANVAALKKDADEALRNYEQLEPKDQEGALGVALDYLRAACESLVEEKLFGKVIQRYDDYVRVQNLEEVVFDQPLGLRLVELHGKISEFLLSHNRSDVMRENPQTIDAFRKIRSEFEVLDRDLNVARKVAINERDARKTTNKDAAKGW